MPSSLEKLSTNRVKLTIEMPFDELKPSLDKAYKDIANQVQIKNTLWHQFGIEPNQTRYRDLGTSS